MSQQARTGEFVLQITPAERQILQLLAQGKSLDEIAQIVEVSAWAVERYLSVLFARMGVSRMAEAVESAKRRGRLLSGQGREGEGNDDKTDVSSGCDREDGTPRVGAAHGARVAGASGFALERSGV